MGHGRLATRSLNTTTLRDQISSLCQFPAYRVSYTPNGANDLRGTCTLAAAQLELGSSAVWLSGCSNRHVNTAPAAAPGGCARSGWTAHPTSAKLGTALWEVWAGASCSARFRLRRPLGSRLPAGLFRHRLSRPTVPCMSGRTHRGTPPRLRSRAPGRSIRPRAPSSCIGRS